RVQSPVDQVNACSQVCLPYQLCAVHGIVGGEVELRVEHDAAQVKLAREIRRRGAHLFAVWTLQSIERKRCRLKRREELRQRIEAYRAGISYCLRHDMDDVPVAVFSPRQNADMRVWRRRIDRKHGLTPQAAAKAEHQVTCLEALDWDGRRRKHSSRCRSCGPL